MIRIFMLLVLLFAGAVHAEKPTTAPAGKEQLQEVERHLVHNGVPKTDAEATVRAMLQARFTVEQAVRAEKQLTSENRWGMTGQAVRDKIQEGVAKGVSPGNILAAAERVQARTQTAGKLAAEVHAANNASVVSAYVDCLTAGLTTQHAQQLTNSLKTAGSTQNLTTETLLAARYMVRQNISSTTVTDVLERALAHS